MFCPKTELLATYGGVGGGTIICSETFVPLCPRDIGEKKRDEHG